MPQGHVWMFLSGGMVLRCGAEALASRKYAGDWLFFVVVVALPHWSLAWSKPGSEEGFQSTHKWRLHPCLYPLSWASAPTAVWGQLEGKQCRRPVRISKRLFKKSCSTFNIWKHRPHRVQCLPSVKLTLDINQSADIGAAHRVGHLTGDGVCEVGVVHCHLKAIPICFGDGDSSFRPPGTNEWSQLH